MERENESIIRENLNRLFELICGVDSAFAFQADELYSLKGNGEDADTAYEIISSERERMRSLPYFGTSKWLHILSSYIYTQQAGSETDDTIFSAFGFSDNTDETNAGRVSYLKNKFTLSAFDKFESAINDPKSLYAESFEASCEDVYNGKCEYCILPVGNSKDGPLSVFRNLISKYDLHINFTADISDSGGTVTTLALLSSSMRQPAQGDFSDYRFEFSISTPSNENICGILASAEYHGFSLVGISSATNIGNSPSLQFTFSAKNVSSEKFKAFVFCLSAIFPSFTPKGLYKHIDK